MVDNLSRNNWIIFIIVVAAAVMISLSVLQVYSMAMQFQVMISGVATHIDTVVNDTAKNMTELTVVLIDQGKAQSLGLNKVVDNQTRELVTSMGNFTNIIANYSVNNDINLNNISGILSDIRDRNVTES